MNRIPVCPTNNILVEIEEKYKQIVQTESGLKFFVDTTYRPEWHATVTGKVVSVPNRIDAQGWHKRKLIKPIVQLGDEIAFSYLVVFDLLQVDDREEVYHEDNIGNAFISQFSNKLGRKLIIRYRMDDGLFDVAAIDEQNRVYDMQQKLTLSEKESWMGKFAFQETNKVTYNNLLTVGDKEYWKVDYGHAIAVKREGEVLPVGGYVILDLPQQVEQHEGKIILLNPIKQKQAEHQAQAKILAIGDPLQGAPSLSCKPGDTVLFDERFVEQYVLWGRDVIVLRQERILALKEEGVLQENPFSEQPKATE